MHKIRGVIENILDEKVISTNYKKKEFVLKTTDDFPQKIIFQCTNECIKTLQLFNIGDEVRVFFNIKSSKNKGNYFNRLEVDIITNVVKGILYSLELTNELKREFLIQCRENTNSSLPLELEELSPGDIESLWNEEFKFSMRPQEIWNFKNSDTTFIHPHKYSEYWGESKTLGLVVLAKYGLQWLDILTFDGKIIYENANDVSFQSNSLILIQKQNMQDWVVYYDKEKNEIIELFILKEMPFEEVTFKNGVYDNGGDIIYLNQLNISLPE